MANTLQLDIDNLNAHEKNSEKHSIVNKITKSIETNQYKDNEILKFLNSNLIEGDDKFTKSLYVNIVNFVENDKLFIKLLKSEDDQLISYTISRCLYFYENEKYSPKFYCDEIFPYISMINRTKLIKILSRNLKNTKRAELFFNYFNSIYGISMARPFFLYCSDEFIMEKLNKNILIANCNELNTILSVKSIFVLKYLQRLIEIKNDNENLKIKIQLSLYVNIFNRLLVLHGAETIELIENNKDKINLSFGRKLTKKLINLSKELILNDVKHYANVLHKNMIFKKLSKEEFDIFFEKLYPNYLKDFPESMTNGTLKKYLDYYKSNTDKVNLLLTTYKNVYRQELFDNSINLKPFLLKLLPKEDRIKFVQKIIDNGDETYLKTEQWHCYLDSKITVKSFKEQIHITSDPKLRRKLLRFMIETCGINDDFETLLDVLKYYNKRHRNEMMDNHKNFIIAIKDHINLDKMVKEHWLEFFGICDLLSLNNDYRSLWQCAEIFLAQLKYFLKNNLPIDKPIQIYIKWVNENRYGGKNKWKIFDDVNKKWEKLCLQKFGELIPENLAYLNAANESYFGAISSWNERNPNDLMSIIDYPWMINEVKTNLTEEKMGPYHYNLLYGYFKNDPKALEYFGDSVSPKSDAPFNMDHLDELIVNVPEFVKENIEKISEYIIHRPIYHIEHFLKFLKSGIFRKIPGLEETIHKECLEIINTENLEEIKCKSTALSLLVFWLDGNEFYEIVRNNYPEEKIAKTGNKLAEYKFQFQKTIVNLMKMYKNHPETFIALRKFCVGDFLKLTIGTLFCICLRTPLYKSLDFLNSCIDTPVSFRKHIIRLICRIGNKQFIYQYLKKLWIDEKNPSIRQVLLENIIQLFIAEPDDIKWSLVKDCVESLTDKDQNSFETLNCFSKISDNYFARYIEICWVLIHKFRKEIQKELIPLKRCIISQIDNNLNLIPTKFIETILTENLFANEIDFSLHNSLSNLATDFILNAPNDGEQKLRIDFIFTLLKSVFVSDWNKIQYDSDGKPHFQKRKYVKNFLTDIINKILIDKEKFKSNNFLLSYLQSKLIEIIPDASIFLYDELLQLQLSQILIKSFDCFAFGASVRDLLDNEIKKHGTYIIPIFGEILTNFSLMPKYFSTYQTCEGLLAEPIQSVDCALLILHVIPIEELFTAEYRCLLERLKAIENEKVKIVLNRFIEENSVPRKRARFT